MISSSFRSTAVLGKAKATYDRIDHVTETSARPCAQLTAMAPFADIDYTRSVRSTIVPIHKQPHKEREGEKNFTSILHKMKISLHSVHL